MTRPRFLRPHSLLKILDPVKEPRKNHYWVGLDGEGVTDGEPHHFNPVTVVTGTKHRYISMSWRAADGHGDQVENREGLSTKDCLWFILSTPADVKIAAYGFGYDLTKILEDLPPELIYLLTHPHKREYKTKGGRTNRRPVIWNGFALELFNTRFKVGRSEPDSRFPKFQKNSSRVVHDLAKFYQCRFVNACQNWGVGTPEERNIMRAMKADRRNLIRYTQEEILRYSNKECCFLAELAQKLDDACQEVGAELRGQYFGAGSIAKALMRSWGTKHQIGELPPEVRVVARHAFFGGRFELSRRGVVVQKVHDWDISAAYPYQIYKLPCMLCGKWSKTTDVERAEKAHVALVNYKLVSWRGSLPPWGPFPFRDTDGSIPFPIECGGGWVHKEEFFAGRRLFNNIRFKGAWVYETQCLCRPFREVPKIYLERLRIGKEGPGIVLKLGTNAIAGSIMQTVGTRPYHCPVWAGMITSGTRAQLLEMLGQHEKWSDVLMMATDGLWSLANVQAPKPLDTGTDIEVTEERTGKKTRKPLGGWEHDVFQNGVFMARPGIYFPLDMATISDNEESSEGKLKDLKARGIGIRTLYQHREAIMAHYLQTSGKEPYIIGDADPLETVRSRANPQGVERFVGFKSGIVHIDRPERGAISRKRDVYGLWTLQQRKIDFKALPKRNEGDGTRLSVRRMPLEQVSAEYDKMKSKMALDDLLAENLELGFYDDEQDDWSDGA